jgi:hypothetical protein
MKRIKAEKKKRLMNRASPFQKAYLSGFFSTSFRKRRDLMHNHPLAERG